jgi:hypothetical protein
MRRILDPNRRCDGVLRRDVLKVGALTALGLNLNDWCRLQSANALSGAKSPKAKARACILIWLDGGPSHLETFDLKPEAPKEVRGPFRPISTKASGMQISEFLPETAKVADKIAIIRSMTSPLGEHNFGSHYMLSGYKPTPALTYPSLGSVVAHTRTQRSVLPPYVSVGDRPNGMTGAGYLPADRSPFVLGGDPAKSDFKVRDLDFYTGLSETRLRRRREYLQRLDRFSRAVETATDQPSDPVFEQAYRLTTSPQAKAAFDLSKESAATREKYGRRTIGQSCLIARRLVERGVPFVTVTDRGWDTHTNLATRLKEGYTGGAVGKIPMLDLAFSSLIGDLDERGLLDETLVLVMGEFGRTPKLNTAGGRDHWPRVFSVALAGGGIPGGQVIGRSDSVGESPADRPVTPSDLALSIYALLGIDGEREFHTSDGRPVPVNQGGELIRELVG